MIDFFSPILILIYAALYGITMKVADLMNEHGLKWFKYSNLLFGTACGFFGALLVFSNMIIANLILAMSIAFLTRRRIDCLNHAIALSIIIIAFVFYSQINIIFFIIFYFIFLIFGGLKDYYDDVLKKKTGVFFSLSQLMLYYPIPTFIYCLFYGNWILFYTALVFMVCYDLTKYYAAKNGYK